MVTFLCHNQGWLWITEWQLVNVPGPALLSTHFVPGSLSDTHYTEIHDEAIFPNCTPTFSVNGN